MATNFLTKIFGSRNDRLLKQYRKVGARINSMEPEYEKLSDDAMRAKLVDAIKTFDALVTDLKGDSVAQSTNLMDNRNNDRFKLSGSTSTELSGDANMAKKALTEADIAALAAGVQVTASAAPEPAVEAPADNVGPGGSAPAGGGRGGQTTKK